MFPFRKNKEPKELVKHRNSEIPKPTFENLSSEDKKAIRKALLKEQGYVCAYCLKAIDEDSMSIEHFLSQSRYDGSIESDLRLDYSNFLAVCDGGKNSKEKHCDKYRASQKEKQPNGKEVQKDFVHLPHPKDLNKAGVSFKYNENTGKVTANKPEIQQELEGLLNLNCQKLKEMRKSVWRGVHTRLQSKNKGKANWTESKAVIREAQKIYDEYKSSNTKEKNKDFFPFVCFILVKIFKDKIKKD